MRLSDRLNAAADGFDDQAKYARSQGNPETAARSDRLAAHMRRLAGNHECAAIWEGDSSANPPQIGETATLVETPNAVREARRALGLSQVEFAALINQTVPGARVTKQAVWRWENGIRNPSPAMAEAIRRLVGGRSATTSQP